MENFWANFMIQLFLGFLAMINPNLYKNYNVKWFFLQK